MPNKTPQELREWYQKFSKELYEKAQIDVTRKEDLGRAGAPINKNLLDENWVDAAKAQLAKNVDLKQLLSNSESISEAFHSDFNLAMITKELVPEAKSGQKEKSLELEQPQLQAAQNNVATM